MIGAPKISLEAAVSPGLWKALTAHAERTGQPVSHIINSALADYLGLSHHTLYQISTATALVEGVYAGAVRIDMLREHGDFGLGTFENLEGEMVTVDGGFFQVRADGSVEVCENTAFTPFAVVTHFAPDETVILEHCPDMRAITSRFDSLRKSENLFFALRVDGVFDFVHARAMRKTREGVPLVEAAAVQPEFVFHNISGTLVGFWTPEYAKTFNVPGYHFHFISDDRKSGGHLLECSFRARQMLISNGQQTLGVGLPWAIAACLTRPHEKVISISGDGGFLFSAVELETAVRLKCNLVHLVWIDGSYDMVRFQEVAKYGRASGVEFGPVDVVGFAEAFGAKGLMITEPAQIGPMLKKALAMEGPVVVDIPVDYRDNHRLVEIVHPKVLN